jgi:hypothetical protein
MRNARDSPRIVLQDGRGVLRFADFREVKKVNKVTSCKKLDMKEQ